MVFEFLFSCILGNIIGSICTIYLYKIFDKDFVSWRNLLFFCLKCKKDRKLSIFDLFPLVGYIINLGRCHVCRAPIPRHYITSTILSILMCLIAIILFEFTIMALCYYVIMVCLLIVLFTDYKCHRVPTSISIIIFLASLIFAYSSGGLFRAVIYSGFSVVLLMASATIAGHKASEDILAFGDIKLIPILSFCYYHPIKWMLFFCLIGILGMLICIYRARVNYMMRISLSLLIVLSFFVSQTFWSIFFDG